MQNSYLPNIDPKKLCDVLRLCSVRWDKMAVKKLDWSIYEEDISKIANAEFFEWHPIVRVYSSGHVFIDENKENVFLVTTDKDWIIQHQFTGWSPLEEINQDIIYTIDWTIKFNLLKIEDNANTRTFNRTWVNVIENWNEIPFVDWVFMERLDESSKIYYRLICLLHFAVKKYEWELEFKKWTEGIIGWKWFNIEKLPETPNTAPNAYIVTKKALEILK